MNSRWNLVFLSLLAAFGLAGCAPQGGRDMARGVAASFVTARALDQATLAIQRDDNPALESAGSDLRRVASAGSNSALIGAFATQLAGEAGSQQNQAQQERGEQRNQLEESSHAKYRAALAFAPAQAPEKVLDARTLNALGYFLADKGSTPADFARAAVLTRAAYRNWDLSGKFADSNELNRAINAQDSYAWALYRMGKYQLARAQQEQVWNIARGMGMTDLSGEIPFHLGEIYRALGLEKKARTAYRAALESTLTDQTRILVEGGLKSLDLARV